MRLRCVLLTAALAGLPMAAPGDASTCPLVTDPRGDATPAGFGFPTPLDAQPAMKPTDLVSVDAWTDKRRLNAVIRLAELPPTQVVPRGFGYEWSLRLRAEGGDIRLYALENNDYYEYRAAWEEIVGSQETGASPGVTVGGAAGAVDTRAGELRLSVPLRALAAYTKVSAGVRWMPSALSFVLLGPPARRVAVSTVSAYVGPGGVGSQSDRADGTRPVVVGRRTCSR